MMKIVIKDKFLMQLLIIPKDLHDLHSNLPFLPERMKINKCNKHVCNLYGEKFTMLFT